MSSYRPRPTSAGAVDPLVRRLEAARFGVLAVLAAVMPLAFWRPATDVFSLPKATLLWIGGATVAALSGWIAARRGRLELGRNALWIAVAVFLALLTLRAVTSPLTAFAIVGEYERYNGLLSYLAAVAVAVAASRLDSGQIRALLRVLVCSGGAMAAYAVLQWADADPVTWNTSGFEPVFSTLGNANLVAGLCAIVAPLGAAVALDARAIAWRVIGAGVAVLSAAGAVASHSFQGPVALVAAVAVFGISQLWASPFRRRWLNLALPAAASLAVVLIVLIPLRGQVRSGLEERRFFWRTAASMVEEHPVSGVGVAAYGQHFLAERPREHSQRFGDSVADAPHDVPLDFFTGGGILLGLAYLALLAVAAVVAVRLVGSTESWLGIGIVGAWFAYLVQSLVSFDVPSHVFVHWLLLGLMAGAAGDGAWQLPIRRRAVATSLATAFAVVAAAWVVLAGVVFVADVKAGTGFRASAEGGDPAAGLPALESATGLVPWRSRYWVLRASVEEHVGDLPGALESIEEAARREPGSSEYALSAARVAAALGDREAAERWLGAAKKRDRWSAAVANALREWTTAAHAADQVPQRRTEADDAGATPSGGVGVGGSAPRDRRR